MNRWKSLEIYQYLSEGKRPRSDMSYYSYVNFSWDDDKATALDPVGRLVYRSNLLGSDRRITNTGGGNTSSKLMDKDPITGRAVEVLWVKGSGGDLRTAGREFFSSLYQEKCCHRPLHNSF